MRTAAVLCRRRDFQKVWITGKTDCSLLLSDSHRSTTSLSVPTFGCPMARHRVRARARLPVPPPISIFSISETRLLLPLIDSKQSQRTLSDHQERTIIHVDTIKAPAVRKLCYTAVTFASALSSCSGKGYTMLVSSSHASHESSSTAITCFSITSSFSLSFLGSTSSGQPQMYCQAPAVMF